jgi:hypothetical protein
MLRPKKHSSNDDIVPIIIIKCKTVSPPIALSNERHVPAWGAEEKESSDGV